jgi:hypothetical protein
MLAGEEHGKREARDRRRIRAGPGRLYAVEMQGRRGEAAGGEGRINWECGRTRASGAQTCPADRVCGRRVILGSGRWMNELIDRFSSPCGMQTEVERGRGNMSAVHQASNFLGEEMGRTWLCVRAVLRYGGGGAAGGCTDILTGSMQTVVAAVQRRRGVEAGARVPANWSCPITGTRRPARSPPAASRHSSQDWERAGDAQLPSSTSPLAMNTQLRLVHHPIAIAGLPAINQWLQKPITRYLMTDTVAERKEAVQLRPGMANGSHAARPTPPLSALRDANAPRRPPSALPRCLCTQTPAVIIDTARQEPRRQ